MKTQPKLPPHQRDTQLLFRCLLLTLIAYLTIAFTIAFLKS